MTKIEVIMRPSAIRGQDTMGEAQTSGAKAAHLMHKLPACLKFPLLACLGGIFLSSLYVFASDQAKLTVRFSGPRSYLCSPDEDDGSYFVGGRYDLIIMLLPDGQLPFQAEYTGISDWTWPEGLVIKVGRSSSPSGAIEFSSVLRERLQLEYYVTESQMREDSLWRSLKQRPVLTAPNYHFAFRVPPELADVYLCISSAWNHPMYGHLTSENSICRKIVVPCSEVAQREVWSTQVSKAYDTGSLDLAVTLADSFIALGWYELHGLIWAGVAAKKLGQYDTALRLLDLCFETNGTVAMLEGWTPGSAPTESGRRFYERQRARLMELKNQQQQR